MDLLIQIVKIIINIAVFILMLPITIVVAMFQSVRDAIRNVKGELYLNSPEGRTEYDKMFRGHIEEQEAGIAKVRAESEAALANPSPESLEFDRQVRDALARKQQLAEYDKVLATDGFEGEVRAETHQDTKASTNLRPSSEELRLFDTLLQAPAPGKEWIEYYYPLNNELLDKYGSTLDWDNISSNQALPWTEKLISKYEERWNWKCLCSNNGVLWNDELVLRFEDKIEWANLAGIKPFPTSVYLLEKMNRNIDPHLLQQNITVRWTNSLTDKFEDLVAPDRLSDSTHVAWSMELIEKYTDQWDWRALSRNQSLPWSEELVSKYEDKWDWYQLELNPGLPWSIDLIRKFEDRFTGLGLSHLLPWSEELIEAFEDKFNWEQIALNRSIKWSSSLVARYGDKVAPYRDDLDLAVKYYNMDGDETLISWTEDVIEKYADKLDWGSLNHNKSLPWSESFMDRYKTKWDWGITFNEGIPWDGALVSKFGVTEAGVPRPDIVGNKSVKWDATLVNLYIASGHFPSQIDVNKDHPVICLTSSLSVEEVDALLVKAEQTNNNS